MKMLKDDEEDLKTRTIFKLEHIKASQKNDRCLLKRAIQLSALQPKRQSNLRPLVRNFRTVQFTSDLVERARLPPRHL